MVLNRKIIFRIFICFLILIFAVFIYAIFFSDSLTDGDGNNAIEKVLKSVGFDSSDGSEDNPAIPLPSSYSSSGSGGAGSGSSGSGSVGPSGSSGSGGSTLHFCTFDLYHTVNGVVPCRCGFAAVCTETGQTCDATFDNGQGACS